MSELAILGGPKAVKTVNEKIFKWPRITKEDEYAVLDVLRKGKMSSIDITQKFEREFAEWLGVKYALAHNNGTSALHSALFGIGIGHGDIIICPSVTYWASCLQVFSLGGTVIFADIDPNTLNITADSIERRINEVDKRIRNRIKAIVVVHYLGMPADMDSIMEVAKKHNLKVIEDCSHAHGAKYKGRVVGTFGDAAIFSLMSGKSLACGEGGILVTNNREIYERAIIFGHYERHSFAITNKDLKKSSGLPWGGYKYRMHQLTSAVCRVQLRYYPERMREIDRAMNYFWDLLKGTPGIRAHRPPKGSGTTKGGWYSPHGIYVSEELGGLSIHRFCEAVTAEGVPCSPGCNLPLHLHPLFNTIDVYHQGKPTRLACLPEEIDIRERPGSLPISETINEKVFSVPWFKKFKPKIIEEYAEAYKKVAEKYKELLPGDRKKPKKAGAWGLTFGIR